MALNLYSLTRSRHEAVNCALRTGGDAVLGKTRVRSYLSRALQHQPSVDHEIRRAALLEALGINLSPYIWISVSKNLHAKHLSLEFHLRRASADTPPTVPPHLDALLVALAGNADTTARVPTISIIDQNGHLHYAKAFSDGTYTHLPLDPSYKGDAAQVQNLQALVDSISSLARNDLSHGYSNN